MKFTVVVSYKETEGRWSEDYDKPDIETLEEAEAWADETIARFNNTLRPHEKARKVIRVEMLGDSEEHDWERTNPYTLISKHKGNYDAFRCSKCGITGRRYGLNTSISRDREFSADGYGSCLQATKLLTRRQKMRDTKRRARDS